MSIKAARIDFKFKAIGFTASTLADYHNRVYLFNMKTELSSYPEYNTAHSIVIHFYYSNIANLFYIFHHLEAFLKVNYMETNDFMHPF